MAAMPRILMVVVCVAVSAMWLASPETHVSAAEPKAVEDDMHELMEYLFEPGYKRLKVSMAEAPKNNAGWKQIKGDSLTLAEAANLLALRKPDENGDAWAALAGKVRDSGAEFYASAKKKDYAAARKHYEAMLKNCNACHDKFADGEHQLKP